MDRTKKVNPKVTPNFDTRREAGKLLGVTTQADQDRRIEEQGRFGVERPQTSYLVTTGFWYRESLGSSGDASYAVRLPMPDSSTAWNSKSSGNIIMPRPGWVVGAFMELSEDRSAGDVIGRVIIDGDTFSFDDALTINSESPSASAVSFFVPESREFPFAEDSLIRPQFSTSNGFAPTSADGRIWFILRFDVA